MGRRAGNKGGRRSEDRRRRDGACTLQSGDEGELGRQGTGRRQWLPGGGSAGRGGSMEMDRGLEGDLQGGGASAGVEGYQGGGGAGQGRADRGGRGAVTPAFTEGCGWYRSKTDLQLFTEASNYVVHIPNTCNLFRLPTGNGGFSPKQTPPKNGSTKY